MKPTSCLGCPLEGHGQDFSDVEGLGKLGVLVCAEASGEAEARDRLPLRPYAPSGGIYERTLRRLGFDRDQFSTTNIIRCRPAGNLLEGMYYEQQAIAHCQPNLLAAISKFRPKVLVALGNVALRSLTGWEGEKKSVSHLRGYPLRALPQFCQAAGFPDLCVLPTFHPAFLRRGAIHLSGVLARDIMRAVRISQGKDRSFILDEPEIPHTWDGPDPWDPGYDEAEEARKLKEKSHLDSWMEQAGLNYLLNPTARELDLFCRDVKARSDAWVALSPDLQAASYLALSSDIETHESASLDEDATDGYTDTIVEQIQFSIEPGQGIALAWTEDHQQAASWLLRLPLPKVGHNWWLFDQKVLRAVGARQGAPKQFLARGLQHDTLQMFHYWQPDLPAHLQSAATFCQFPFPWKHLAGTNLPFYGCVDTDATLRTYVMARRTMEDRGIWLDPDSRRDQTGYLAQVQAVRPILADMEDRGVPVDDARRLKLDVEFDAAAAEVFAELDQRFPEEARKIDPKEGYAGIPPAVKKLLGIRPKTKPKKGAPPPEPWPEPISMEEVSKVVFEKPGDVLEDGTRDEGEKFRYVQKEFSSVQKWTRIFEFSPNSSQQLMSYMTCRKHKIPTKKGGKNTTEKKELERLAAKHSDNFYFKVIEYRELTKMRSTYIDGWRPHADGRVHTTFTFDTATSQLSSRNPNVQNAPKHGKLADAFRAIVRHPEKLIVEWDYKSFHVLTTGFEAKSPEYMRLARIDMHSFIAWHFLRLPGADELYSLPDDELREKLEWFKTDKKRKFVRDKQAKPCIAEGELVLTDKGLVPIEKITLAHRVWDGVEWVTHGGLVYQGVKEVITYDGLTATPCHKVVTRNGDQVPFGKAASGMVELESTGIAGTPVRTRHRDKLEASARERILARAREVLELRETKDSGFAQLSSWEDDGVPELRAEKIYSSNSLGTSLRCHNSSLQQHAATFSRVYDIADAGPRKCYTVSGKLVGNCILGIGFGLGVEKMFNMNLEYFENLAQAKRLKDMVQGIFPRVFAWQDEIRELAHRQTFLRSRYGSVRWFYEVKVPDGKGGMRSGEQSEEAIAFLPANDAFGHIRMGMREIERKGLAEKWSMFNTVHDSLLFLVDPPRLEEHCQEIYPILLAPSKVLIDPQLAPDGLSVDVECSAGVSWAKADQKEVKLQTGQILPIALAR
jgi:uracil-DNA glycosylase family 4